MSRMRYRYIADLIAEMSDLKSGGIRLYLSHDKRLTLTRTVDCLQA